MIPRKQKRILVSEDTDLWQAIFQRLLTDSGYDVRSATNRTQTQDLLDHCLFDAAIVDICLDPSDESNRDGVATMQKIKALNEGTNAVVLTGHGSVDLAVEAMREFNVFHFLEKERFNKEKFLEIINEACTKASYAHKMLRLTDDALRWFAEIDMHDASSLLQIHVDVLDKMLKGLMAGLVPVVACNAAHLLKTPPNGPAIVFECWSKAIASAVQIRVTLGTSLNENQANQVVVETSKEKTTGYVVATEKPYNIFVAG